MQQYVKSQIHGSNGATEKAKKPLQNTGNEEIRKLQQALKDAGYGSYLGSSGVDGILGPNTKAAISAYQKANGLKVDGIAGEQTLGKLYGSGQTQVAAQPQQTPAAAAPTPVTAPAQSYRYDKENDPVYQNALKKLADVEANAPVLAGTFDQQVQDLFEQVMNQKDFSYDLNGDALWQQYKDQYTNQGKLAMMDTMGQAAALTGGYGSSYTQNAGQQAYQGYLQQLNDRVPELYGLALEKYNNDQALLKDKLGTAVQLQANEYGKHQDALAQHNIEVDRARSDADTAYDRGSNEWYTAEQMKRQDDETQYARKSESYDRLANLIYSTGYTPSQTELEAAGMSAMEANAYRSSYEKQEQAENEQKYQSQQSEKYNRLVDLIAAGYQPTEADLKAAGMSAAEAEIYSPAPEGASIAFDKIGAKNDAELTEELKKIAETGGDLALLDQLIYWEEMGYINSAATNALYVKCASGEREDENNTQFEENSLDRFEKYNGLYMNNQNYGSSPSMAFANDYMRRKTSGK